ncbi:MAG: tandem-95 repeat protein [Acidimicrobiia bacterium]|nr:MAG: tandem-95 repeat protein [Acidimicrobiia bacterium]
MTETNGSPSNLSDSETITVTVGEGNLPPILDAVGDQSTDELVNLSFTATASDPDDPANLLSFSLSGEPAGATITAGGVFSWTPTEAQGPGSYTFDVVVTETNGLPTNLSDSETITITVDEVNVAPVVPPSSFTVDEGGVLEPGPASGVLAAASDAEGNPISAIIDSPPAFGTLVLAADGSFAYTHDGSENFADTFTFVASDGIDPTAPITATITIDPINDTPVMAGVVLTPDESTVVGTVVGGPVASDGDDDPLTFSFVSPDPTFTIDPLTGDITLAAGLDFETIPTYTLTVSVADPSGASATADVVINVADVDEVPVAAPAAFPIVESLPLGSTVGTVSAWDPEGESVSFSLVAGDPGGQFTIDPITGELILVSALDAGETPSYLLDVVVTDPGGNSTSTAVIVVVSAAAPLPPLNASPLGFSDLLTLDEDTSVLVAPLVNDTDPDDDVLFVSWIDEPVNGTLVPNGDGTYTYRPDPDFFGAESLDYGISDGRGGISQSTVNLAILAVNDPPVTPNVDTELEFVPNVEIPIPDGVYDPEGDPVWITAGTPAEGSVTLIGDVFTYVPPPEWNGTDTFTYVVTDSSGSSSTGLVTIRVTQIDGQLVAIDLVSVEEVTPPPVAPSSGIVVDSIKLLVGTVSEMAGLLGIPLLAVGAAFLASIIFGFSRNFLIGRGPVFLPAAGPSTVGVVRVPAGAVVTALEGPGEEYPLVYRYPPAETGIRATGRHAQRGSTRWIEVETPEGDGWVIARFVTPMIPAGSFAADEQVAAAVESIRAVLGARGDLRPIVTSPGLEVAYYAPPKHFEDEELAGLLAGDASWGWWDPTGSTPSVRGEFGSIVADPLVEAMALEGRTVAEAVVEIPVELVNFPSLTFSQPDHLGWRVFFEYEDDEPKLAAIWREGVTNPASV